MGRPLIDITGKRFGELVVLHRVKDRISGTKWEVWYRVKCDCGRSKSMRGYLLRQDRVHQCGHRPGNFRHGASLTVEYRMWGMAKNRAKEKGLKFNIQFTDIKIPKFCPLLQIPIFRKKRSFGYNPNSPSLDRKIPRKGYIKGNIWVISKRANAMKNDGSYKDWKKLLYNWSKEIRK